MTDPLPEIPAAWGMSEAAQVFKRLEEVSHDLLEGVTAGLITHCRFGHVDHLLLRPAVRRPQPVEKTIVLPEKAAAALQALAYERGESEEALLREALEAFVGGAE